MPRRIRTAQRARARRSRDSRFHDRHGSTASAWRRAGRRIPMSYRSNADLGGQDGHGAVHPEPEGELFHAAWEPRVLALTLAMGATGLWNIDTSRAARETLADYGELSYYQIWLAGLEKLLLQTGAVQADEIVQGRVMQASAPTRCVLRAGQVAAVLARGSPT